METKSDKLSMLDKQIIDIRKEMDVLEQCFIDGIFKIPSEQHLYYRCLSVNKYRLELKKEIDASNMMSPIDYNYSFDEKTIRY